MTETIQTQQNTPTVKETAGNILNQVSGYIATKVIQIGIEHEMFNIINNHQGLEVDQLAEKLNYDEELLQVWIDSAYAQELIQIDDSGMIYLSPNLDELLLNTDSPAYLAGLPTLFTKAELFDNFEKNIRSGDRTWWDQVSNEWIEKVAETTLPNYTRMIESGFENIPNLLEMLEDGVKVLELACGTSRGLVRMAKSFPNSEFVGLDGDQYSLTVSEDNVDQSEIPQDIRFIHSTFEEMDIEDEFDLIFINASMHECRNIEKVTENIHHALKDNGVFVIADLPFPERKEDYRSLPSKIMLGINFFEIQIDDLLLPTSEYVNLLENQGFKDVDHFDMTPTHSVIFGYKA